MIQLNEYKPMDIVAIAGNNMRVAVITGKKTKNYTGIMLSGKGKNYTIPPDMILYKIGTADEDCELLKGRSSGSNGQEMSVEEFQRICEEEATFSFRESPSHKAWKALATKKPGDTVVLNGRRAVLASINLRAKKYPILASIDGKMYKFSELAYQQGG